MRKSGRGIYQLYSKRPNGLGIYDMTGNVWEWTDDWYGENYYGSSPKNNPTGPSSEEEKVFRDSITDMRAMIPLDIKSGKIGFRVAAPAR